MNNFIDLILKNKFIFIVFNILFLSTLYIFNQTLNINYFFVGGDFNDHLNNNYFNYISYKWDLRNYGFINRQYGEYLLLQNFTFLNSENYSSYLLNFFYIGSYFSFIYSLTLLSNFYKLKLSPYIFIFSYIYALNSFTYIKYIPNPYSHIYIFIPIILTSFFLYSESKCFKYLVIFCFSSLLSKYTLNNFAFAYSILFILIIISVRTNFKNSILLLLFYLLIISDQIFYNFEYLFSSLNRISTLNSSNLDSYSDWVETRSSSLMNLYLLNFNNEFNISFFIKIFSIFFYISFLYYIKNYINFTRTIIIILVLIYLICSTFSIFGLIGKALFINNPFLSPFRSFDKLEIFLPFLMLSVIYIGSYNNKRYLLISGILALFVYSDILTNKIYYNFKPEYAYSPDTSQNTYLQSIPESFTEVANFINSNYANQFSTSIPTTIYDINSLNVLPNLGLVGTHPFYELINFGYIDNKYISDNFHFYDYRISGNLNFNYLFNLYNLFGIKIVIFNKKLSPEDRRLNNNLLNELSNNINFNKVFENSNFIVFKNKSTNLDIFSFPNISKKFDLNFFLPNTKDVFDSNYIDYFSNYELTKPISYDYYLKDGCYYINIFNSNKNGYNYILFRNNFNKNFILTVDDNSIIKDKNIKANHYFNGWLLNYTSSEINVKVCYK